jgi:hypothetical protein
MSIDIILQPDARAFVTPLIHSIFLHFESGRDGSGRRFVLFIVSALHFSLSSGWCIYPGFPVFWVRGLRVSEACCYALYRSVVVGRNAIYHFAVTAVRIDVSYHTLGLSCDYWVQAGEYKPLFF